MGLLDIFRKKSIKGTKLNTYQEISDEKIKNVTDSERKELIFSDSELGDIIINSDTGKIMCDSLNYNNDKLYSDFPIQYKMSSFEFSDIKNCNFEKYKGQYIDELHLVFSMREEIEEKIIQEIWEWFCSDYTLEQLKNDFLGLNVSVRVCLCDDEFEAIDLCASWCFEEKEDDINSGYADFTIYKNPKSIKLTEIGFY